MDARTYPWGDHFDSTRCCMGDSRPGIPEPAVPGEYPADGSPYGVRDMAGNVSEWCLDSLAPKVEHRDGRTVQVDGRLDGEDEDPEQMRVYRGGAWVNEPWTCRSYHRAGLPPSARLTRLGFRLVSPLDRD